MDPEEPEPPQVLQPRVLEPQAGAGPETDETEPQADPQAGAGPETQAAAAAEAKKARRKPPRRLNSAGEAEQEKKKKEEQKRSRFQRARERARKAKARLPRWLVPPEPEMTDDERALRDAVKSSSFGIVDAALLGRSLTRECLLMRRGVSGPHLDLSAHRMNSVQCTVLARAGLSLNKSVDWLVLSDGEGMRLGDMGGRALASAVRVNTTLTALTLRQCGLTQRALEALCTGLRSNRVLTHLSLARNGVGEAGLQLLASMLRRNKGLLQLDLSENHFGDSAVGALLEGLKRNRTLTHLDLANCRLADGGAGEVFKTALRSRTLSCINVSGRDMDPDGYVDNLSLFAAQVFGKMLLQGRHLAQVNVSGVWLPIFDAREGHTVALRGREVQDLDVMVLVEALAANPALTHLDLSCNKISSSAIVMLLEKVIKPRSRLRSVSIADNYLDLASADKIGELLFLASDSDIESFRIANRFELPVRELTGAEGVAEIEIPGSSELDPKEERIISRLLFLNTTTHTLNGLSMMDDVGEADFANREIEYYEVLFLMRQFQRHQFLTKLNFSGIQLNAHGAQAVAEGIRQHGLLRDLNLENNELGPLGATAVIRALETTPKLQIVNLSWTGMQDVGAEAVAQLLRTNTNVRELELRGNDISRLGLQAIAEVLQDEPDGRLRRLSLCHNSVRPESAALLAQVLPVHGFLEELEVEDNVIGLAGVRILMQALGTPHRLGTQAGLLALNVAYGMQDEIERYAIGEEGGRLIAQMVRDNRRLTSLNVAEMGIGTAGIRAMADMLSGNFTMQHLGLLSCGAGTAGALALAQLLTTSRTLKTLNLRNNGIGDEGLRAIVDALRANKSMEVVNVSLNGVTEEGSRHLCAAVEDFSDALRIIVFGENETSEECRGEMEAAAAARGLAINFLNYRQPSLSGVVSKLTQIDPAAEGGGGAKKGR